jgi:hypothetical protein
LGAFTACFLLIPLTGGSQTLGVDQPFVDPYEGAWIPVKEPGSGLFIDQQDDTLVVTIFSYQEDGSPSWYLAAGKLEEGVFSAQAFQYTGGACLNCAWKPPEQGSSVPIRLEFVAQTQAWLQWDGGESIPIESLFFGAGGLTISTIETVFGHQSAPDMLGRWLFIDEDPGSPFLRTPLFNAVFFLDPGGFGFSADEFAFSWVCKTAEFFPDNGFANCQLEDNRDSNDEVTDRAIFTAYWGDITPDSAVMYRGGAANAEEEGHRGNVLGRGFRLTGPVTIDRERGIEETPDSAGPTLYLEKGPWTVPGEPGSGVFLDIQDDVLVFVIFTYDEAGDPVWFQGSGHVVDGVVESEASRFVGGSCLNCEYADTHEPTDSVNVRFEFTAKTTAFFQFGEGDPKPIRSLPFDVPQFRQ